MHISRHGFIAIFAYSSAVNAAPALKTCNRIDLVYALLNGALKQQASSLCVSFLGGDKTVQATQTQTVPGAARTTTVTAPDMTQTVTNDVTNINRVTITVGVTQANPTTTVTSTTTAATRTVYQKRDMEIEKRAIPPALAVFASSRISSACSCIATPTTRTITNTQVRTAAGLVQTQTQPAKIITVTYTNVIQITAQDTITNTVGPAATETTTIITTFTAILVKPKLCFVAGAPNGNAVVYDTNTNSNPVACGQSCKTDDRCLSYSYNIVTTSSGSFGTCRKYDKSVTDAANTSPGNGLYYFSDKAC